MSEALKVLVFAIMVVVMGVGASLVAMEKGAVCTDACLASGNCASCSCSCWQAGKLTEQACSSRGNGKPKGSLVVGSKDISTVATQASIASSFFRALIACSSYNLFAQQT